jgi:hypothetical protein
MSGVRAHVVNNLPLAGIDIVFVQQTDQGRVVWGPGSSKRAFVDGAATPAVDDVDVLRLSDDDARALLAGLLSHYQGGDDLRALRRDYDAERARVDKLIDAIVSPPVTGVRHGRT